MRQDDGALHSNASSGWVGVVDDMHPSLLLSELVRFDLHLLSHRLGRLLRCHDRLLC